MEYVSITISTTDISRTVTQNDVSKADKNGNSTTVPNTFTQQSVSFDDLHSNASIMIGTLTRHDVSMSIPVLCLFILVMTMGTVGNFLVLVTYFRRIQKSTTNLFIFSLASFDIINCCLALPFETHDIINPYTYPLDILCRFYKFLKFTADLSAGYIIVCISFDRYIRIARPHRKLSLPRAKIAVITISVLSVLLCSMSLFVFGTQSVTIESHPYLKGTRCGINKLANQTIFPLLFFTIMLVCFGAGVMILVVVYTRLGIRVRKWNLGRKEVKKDRPSTLYSHGYNWKDDSSSRVETPDGKLDSPRQVEMFTFSPIVFEEPSDHDTESAIPSSPTTQVSRRADFVRQISRSLDQVNLETVDTNASPLDQEDNDKENFSRNNNLPHVKPGPIHENGARTLPLPRSNKLQVKPVYKNVRRKSSMAALLGLKRRMTLSKTTIMFMIATATFVASRIPYICVIIAFMVNPKSMNNLTAVSTYFYRIALHSYTISYAANPLIYSFMNPKFRQECKTLVIKAVQKMKCRSKSFDLRD